MLCGRGGSRFRCPSGAVVAVAACLVLIWPARLQSEEPAETVSYSVSVIGPNGAYVYVPERWGILHLNLVNRQDHASELLALTNFKDEPTLQYGRRVRIPGKSRMRTWHPIRLPAKASEGGQDYAIRTMVMDVSQEREVPLRSETGHLQLDGVLRIRESGPVIGLIGNDQDDDDSRAVFDLVTATRAHWRLSTRVARLPSRILGPGEENLNTFDQIVIADDRIIDDGAGLAAIRHWVLGGGHLWIMLDRVDSRLLELIFGDEIECGVVDRLGLTNVVLDDAGKEHWDADFEKPVEFVRVVASHLDAQYSVDGWPAAFWKSFGAGRVLVTTLGPRGWMRPRTPAELEQSRVQQAAQGAADTSAPPVRFAPLDPMIGISKEFFLARPEQPLPASVLEPLVQEYVGYAIPSRWLVFTLLIGFSAVLAGLGSWLLRAGRLELLGAVGPGLAIAVTAGLVLAGWLQRAAVTPVVAELQFAEIVPGTDEVRIEGLTGLYSPEPGTADIEARKGGLYLPDMTGLTGSTRRMVWTDLDVWRWENLPETAGLRSGAALATRQMPERVEANATFGPDGLTGRLTAGEGRHPSDVVIATRDGRIGVDLQPDGGFAARATSVFAPDQFLSADLLTDEQSRRRTVLKHLLANPERSDFPSAPQLLFWTDPWSTGFSYGQERRLLGAALVAVPLHLERPPTGTEVLVPAPFLPCKTTLGPDGSVVTGLYDHNTRRWSEKNAPSAAWLKFRIPEILLPVEMQRVRVAVQVAGPIGRLEIAGHRQAEPVPVKTWSDPVGTLTFETTETDVFPVSPEGDVLLRVAGGDPSQTKAITSVEKLIPWRIESLHLELQLKTTAPPDGNPVTEAGR